MKLIKITDRSISNVQLEKIYDWYKDKDINKYLRPRYRTRKKITETLSNPKIYNFLIHDKDKDIGYIYISKKLSFLYLSILLDKKYWGKGYGRRAMLLIEKKAKELKAKKIILALYHKNKRALILYKSLGYVLTGKKGKIITMDKII